MLIDFDSLQEVELPGMNGGDGSVSAMIHFDHTGKQMVSYIHPLSSIGMHRHETSMELNYVLSGEGKHIVDGQEEILRPGLCAICGKGSSHSLINTGTDDLVTFTVVVEC